MTYRRGDIVICAASGDYGKPRPAVVLQSDLFNPTHASVTVCPVTSHLTDAPLFRVPLKPTPGNGLKTESQAMTDKLVTLRAERISRVVGHLAESDLGKIDSALALWLGLRG